MKDELYGFEDSLIESMDEEAFAFLERDARRYNKAFTEEEEAKRA